MFVSPMPRLTVPSTPWLAAQAFQKVGPDALLASPQDVSPAALTEYASRMTALMLTSQFSPDGMLGMRGPEFVGLLKSPFKPRKPVRLPAILPLARLALFPFCWCSSLILATVCVSAVDGCRATRLHCPRLDTGVPGIARAGGRALLVACAVAAPALASPAHRRFRRFRRGRVARTVWRAAVPRRHDRGRARPSRVSVGLQTVGHARRSC